MKPKIKEGNFYKEINKAINEDRHVEYLRQYLKDYEKYKKFFDQALTDQNPKRQVYTFKVTYLLKKPVWRIFEICGSQRFDKLAEAVIDSMEWYCDHMYGFSFPDPTTKVRRFGPSPFVFYAPGWEDDAYPTFKSNEIKIENIDYNKYRKLGFIFDFGDCHEFDIEMVKSRLSKHNEVADEFPKMIDIRGVAPEQYPFYEEDDEFTEINKEEVKERQRGIEQELTEIFKKGKTTLNIMSIKKLIANDNYDDLMYQMMKLGGNDNHKINQMLDLANDAWNYFPHKDLGNISPAENALPKELKE